MMNDSLEKKYKNKDEIKITGTTCSNKDTDISI